MLKLICKKSVVQDDNNKNNVLTFCNYYIELDNHYRIAIKPCFKEDYLKLRILSQEE